MRRAAAIGVVALLWLGPRPAHAIRPFVTDDARVVGRGYVQLETYWRRDRESLQHWILPAIGPTEWLELTLGAVHGLGELRAYPSGPEYSIAGPLLQGKLLLREAVPNEPPGFALAIGAVPPLGRGAFVPAGPSAFSYLAMTQAFIKEDDFLVHANVGVSTIAAPGADPAKVTWGLGAQVETLFDFHLIGEVFSGDPYARGTGGAYQIGFRQIFDQHLQLDFTYGSGLFGDALAIPWVSSGIRLVSDRRW